VCATVARRFAAGLSGVLGLSRDPSRHASLPASAYGW
jgi:hypothetical protein